MPRELRVRSCAPTSYSRSRIWRLSDGCAVCSRRSAATVRLPSSATATKYRRWRSSISHSMPTRHDYQLTKSFSEALGRPKSYRTKALGKPTASLAESCPFETSHTRPAGRAKIEDEEDEHPCCLDHWRSDRHRARRRRRLRQEGREGGRCRSA